MNRLIPLVFLIAVWVSGCSGSSGSRDSGSPTVTYSNLYIAAWFPAYDTGRAIQSFSNHLSLFDEINPVWYNLNPNYFNAGQAPFRINPVNQTEIMNAARDNGIKVIPTIQNFGTADFDPTIIGPIINSPTLRARHIEEILNIVLNGGYDGIDIDYENLALSDRNGFSSFIGELGTALHQHAKELSVAVYARVSDNTPWRGPGAQDWRVIAGSADTIKIMAYDYHWSTFHAGPVAPIDWLRSILEYCRTIPAARGKLIVGLPLYGLDWGPVLPASEVMFADAQRIHATYPILNASRDNVDHTGNTICGTFLENVEPHFQYTVASGNHTVYYQDSQSLKARLDLISRYRDVIRGVTFWRLGGEDPLMWMELSKYK